MGLKTQPATSRNIIVIFSLYEERFFGYLDIEVENSKSINGQNNSTLVARYFLERREGK
jgi:hypothetical protein